MPAAQKSVAADKRQSIVAYPRAILYNNETPAAGDLLRRARRFLYGFFFVCSGGSSSSRAVSVPVPFPPFFSLASSRTAPSSSAGAPAFAGATSGIYGVSGSCFPSRSSCKNLNSRLSANSSTAPAAQHQKATIPTKIPMKTQATTSAAAPTANAMRNALNMFLLRFDFAHYNTNAVFAQPFIFVKKSLKKCEKAVDFPVLVCYDMQAVCGRAETLSERANGAKKFCIFLRKTVDRSF